MPAQLVVDDATASACLGRVRLVAVDNRHRGIELRLGLSTKRDVGRYFLLLRHACVLVWCRDPPFLAASDGALTGRAGSGEREGEKAKD